MGRCFRINLDGSTPTTGSRKPYWSLGHRNHRVWSSPTTNSTAPTRSDNDDEINLIEKAAIMDGRMEGYCDKTGEQSFRKYLPGFANRCVTGHPRRPFPGSTIITKMPYRNGRIRFWWFSPSKRPPLPDEAEDSILTRSPETTDSLPTPMAGRDLCISPAGDVYIKCQQRQQ